MSKRTLFTMCRPDGSSAYAGALLVGGKIDKKTESWEELKIVDVPDRIGPFEIKEHRPWDSPQMVHDGIVQAAIVNRDCLLYRRADEQLWGQEFVGGIEARCEYDGLGTAELCIIYYPDAYGGELESLNEWKSLRGIPTVVSEAPAFARVLMKRHGVEIKHIVPSMGGTEDKVVMYSRLPYKTLGIEIVATGTSLKKRGLKVLRAMERSNACLIINPDFDVTTPNVATDLVRAIERNYNALSGRQDWQLLRQLLPYYKYTGRDYYTLTLQPAGIEILKQYGVHTG